jgi:peptide/nickel transport system substrate-binding protein
MRSISISALFALLAAAAVVASPEGEAAQEEQVLIYAGATDHFAGEETATDPGFENNYDMTGPSYESLIGYDPELLRRDPPEYVLVPHLAESYSTDDRIVWTFNLRRGIKFHTGNEMQADDVKFSIERVARWEEYINAEATGSPPNIRSVVPVIERVEIVDDYTVRIHGRDGKPQLLMLDTLSFGHLAIMDREVVLANEKDGDSGLVWLRGGNSAGTGPYRVVEALPREKTVYEKFEDYWGGVANNPDPFFDRVVLINIPEAGARRLALESGEVDVVSDLPNAVVADMEDEAPAGVSYLAQPSFGRITLVMHTAGGPLTNVKVRQAIRYAIDYEGLVELNRGTVSILQTTAWTGGQGHNPELAYYYKQDIEKAKALMAEAGYADGLEMDLWGHKEGIQGVSPPLMIEKIGADLEQIGIKTTLKSPTWTVMFESLYSTDPEAHSPALYLKGYGAQGSSDPDAPGGFPDLVTDQRTVIDASGFKPEYLPDVDFDYIAEMMAKIRTETDPDARGMAVEELDLYLLEWHTNLPLIQSQDTVAYRSDLSGVHWHGFTDTFDWAAIRRTQ